MGKANRSRRAAAKRKRDRRSPRSVPIPAGRASRAPAPPGPADTAHRREDVTEALLSGAEAFRRELRPLQDAKVAYLCQEPAGAGAAGWTTLVDRTVGETLTQSVTALWSRGWQPGDVTFMVARNPRGPGRLGLRHQRLAVDAVAAEAEIYAVVTLDPRWRDQLDALDARIWWDPRRPHLGQWAWHEGVPRSDALRTAIELLSVLTSLRPVERLCPLPGTAQPASGARDPDDTGRSHSEDVGGKMLAKVRALLAKAESTTFPDEAETLTAKAQELMARHAIDEAMVDRKDQQHDGRSAGAVGWRIHLEDPYASGKAALLGAVGRANRCQSVYHRGLGFSTVFGYPVDLRNTEVLFTSLLVQATAAMAAAGRHTDRAGRSRTRSFRTSFFQGYAHRIGVRLREANDATVAEAAATAHGGALVPVLASREEAVAELLTETFPRLGHHRGSVTNGAGFHAGQAAGQLADLGHHAAVEAP